MRKILMFIFHISLISSISHSVANTVDDNSVTGLPVPYRDMHYGLQPIVILTASLVTPMGQKSQALTVNNTVFVYQPGSSSEWKSLAGLFFGTEYSIQQSGGWQLGLGFYQARASSVGGSETQAPSLNSDSVNLWNYHYNIQSRQIFIENKLFSTVRNYYHPYLLIGLGVGFNHVYGFTVTPNNSGEVATAIYSDALNRSFIYTAGVGMDVDVSTSIRLGAGYRFAYLGRYDLGGGTLNTGTGGSIFTLPALQSKYLYNSEVLVQLTYLL